MCPAAKPVAGRGEMLLKLQCCNKLPPYPSLNCFQLIAAFERKLFYYRSKIFRLYLQPQTHLRRSDILLDTRESLFIFIWECSDSSEVDLI